MYLTTLCHVSDNNVHSYHRDNFKFYELLLGMPNYLSTTLSISLQLNSKCVMQNHNKRLSKAYVLQKEVGSQLLQFSTGSPVHSATLSLRHCRTYSCYNIGCSTSLAISGFSRYKTTFLSYYVLPHF